MSWQRRDTLLGLAALAAALPLPSLALPSGPLPQTDSLSSLFPAGWTEAMARIVGPETEPALPQAAALDRLHSRLAGQQGGFRERVRALIQEDLHAGRSILADGWVLAESEVLIYRCMSDAIPAPALA